MIRNIKIDYSPDIEEKIFYEDGDKPYHCILGDAGTELLINKINEIIDYINGSNITLDSTKIVIDENIVKQYFEDINKEDI